MALTPEEIERYKRHLVLREVGGQGQQKIKAARVLVVGAGGLGSPVLMYLAAAGVGTLGIIDDDRVSLDNLQRQIVHDTAHVGVAKVASARRRDRAGSTRTCSVETYDAAPRCRQRARDHLRATTSSPTARTISPPATSSAMPAIWPRSTLVFARGRPVRRLSHHPEAARDGRRRQALSRAIAASSRRRRRRARSPTAPRSACWAPPSASSARCRQPRCSRRSSASARRLAGRLLLYDARSARFSEIKFAWDPANPLSGTAPTIRDLSIHQKARPARSAWPDWTQGVGSGDPGHPLRQGRHRHRLLAHLGADQSRCRSLRGRRRCQALADRAVAARRT